MGQRVQYRDELCTTVLRAHYFHIHACHWKESGERYRANKEPWCSNYSYYANERDYFAVIVHADSNTFRRISCWYSIHCHRIFLCLYRHSFSYHEPVRAIMYQTISILGVWDEINTMTDVIFDGANCRAYHGPDGVAP